MQNIVVNSGEKGKNRRGKKKKGMKKKKEKKEKERGGEDMEKRMNRRKQPGVVTLVRLRHLHSTCSPGILPMKNRHCIRHQVSCMMPGPRLYPSSCTDGPMIMFRSL